MKKIAIIPSRYQSSRFPGKPLCLIGEKTMIQHVYQKVKSVDAFNEIVVATDDKRIFDEVERFGGNVVMTSQAHRSGTERCAEAFSLLPNYDTENTIVVNIQGDEPFIQKKQIEEVMHCFENPLTEIATLIQKINNEEDLKNPNVVKVAVDSNMKALYFSRTSIPYLQSMSFEQHVFYRHIGIYAYKAQILTEIVKLQASLLEKAENLEQLRWIEHGFSIQTHVTQHDASLSIDTPEDMEKAIEIYNKLKHI